MFSKQLFSKDQKREAVLLFLAIAFIGLSMGFSENIYNNFYKTIGMGTNDRTILEPIREIPGLLMMFIVAAISFLTLGRMGAVAMVIRAAGLLLIGQYAKTFSPVFLAYMVIVSLGDHIFTPLRNSIGISVANTGYEGRVIGLMDAANTIFYTLACIPIFLFFSGSQLGDYKILFFLSAGSALIAGISFFFMHTKKAEATVKKPRIVFKRKFALYYFISFISGLRKQIFLVFAPWLLVETFSQPLGTMTLLNIAGSITVLFFNPLIGHLIDKHGERRLLIGGGIVCVILYTLYALLCTKDAANPYVITLLLIVSFIDRLSLSTLIGRDIYVKHTAEHIDEIMPTLSTGVSMDHVASVVAPILGGLLWTNLGAQWVFAAGAVIGVVYTISCALVPAKKTEPCLSCQIQ